MGVIYEQNCPETTKIFSDVKARKHKILNDHVVRVNVIEVRKVNKEGETAGLALKKNKAHVPAKVRILPLRERATNEDFEAEVQVDTAMWDDYTLVEKEAVADSLLSTIGIKYDKDGVATFDDLNRVKLGVKPDDYNLSGNLKDFTNVDHPLYKNLQHLLEKIKFVKEN